MNNIIRIERIRDHLSANCKVNIYDDGRIELISYSTRVMTVLPDGSFELTGLYSRTTIKHISWFCRQYLDSNYYAYKRFAGTGWHTVGDLKCHAIKI